jgi:hypothetical protein
MCDFYAHIQAIGAGLMAAPEDARHATISVIQGSFNEMIKKVASGQFGLIDPQSDESVTSPALPE